MAGDYVSQSGYALTANFDVAVPNANLSAAVKDDDNTNTKSIFLCCKHDL